MDPLAIGILMFGCCAGGTVLGMAIAVALPKHHLNEEAKDAVTVATTVVATLAALVIGLLVSSAKTSFDAKDAEIKLVAVRIISLDRAMSDYGAETRQARDALRAILSRSIAAIWKEGSPQAVDPSAILKGDGMAGVRRPLLALHPADDDRRALRTSALSLTDQIEDARWDALLQKGGSIRWPVAVLLSFWFVVIFGSIGLFAPVNVVVVAVLLICSLSVSAAIYMLVQMDRPFSGFIQISNEPLKVALGQIGK
jgi:hypothetical protein